MLRVCTLQEAYGNHGPAISKVAISKDKKRLSQPKLEALLNEDQSQTQEELQKLFKVGQQAILKTIESTRFIQKERYCVAYKLKPRDVETKIISASKKAVLS